MAGCAHLRSSLALGSPRAACGFPPLRRLEHCHARAWRFPPLPALEELRRALVLLRSGARVEGAEIAAPAGPGIALARVEPIAAVGQSADHNSPPWPPQ